MQTFDPGNLFSSTIIKTVSTDPSNRYGSGTRQGSEPPTSLPYSGLSKNFGYFTLRNNSDPGEKPAGDEGTCRIR
jgi:hypothetical protein